MTRVDLGPLSLNVEIAGNGPPVVLLHGFTGSAAGWGVVIDALSPEYTTVAIDIVGHGRSDSPPTAESYEMRRAYPPIAPAACVPDRTPRRRESPWSCR